MERDREDQESFSHHTLLGSEGNSLRPLMGDFMWFLKMSLKRHVMEAVNTQSKHSDLGAGQSG